MLWGREPAAFLSALAIIIDLAVTFGLNLDVVQIGLVNAALMAVVGFAVRQSVTPVGPAGV